MTMPSPQPVDPWGYFDADTARSVFATLPSELRAAMKVAAQRNAWCADTWPIQVTMAHEALAAGWQPADLAQRYQQPPRL
jgi:hypothetical protein